MKKCLKYHEDKPLSDFYKHPQMGDGHLNKCKPCTKKDANKHRLENVERLKAYDRRRANRPHRVAARKRVAERWKGDPKLRAIVNQRRAEWRRNNVVKRAAHVVTGNAIRSGRLVPQLCEVCSNRKVEAHHDDHAKPLDVRWLCHKHHMNHHKNEREKTR